MDRADTSCVRETGDSSRGGYELLTAILHSSRLFRSFHGKRYASLAFGLAKTRHLIPLP
jgi:hypothetical protein